MFGFTPLLSCSHLLPYRIRREAICLLLHHKATPPDAIFEKVYLQKPAESFSKVILMGYPKAGKSTLAKSLTTEIRDEVESLASRFEQVSGVEKNTSGIVPLDVRNERFGNMTIYDLAGQSEFYASHDMALRSILDGSPSSIIVLVVNMSGGKDCFRKSILHWVNFASNLFTDLISKPFLFIIGSYADIATSSTVQSCESMVESLNDSNLFSKFDFQNFVALDCRYPVSLGMTKLQSHVAECCQTLKENQIEIFTHHCFYVAIAYIFSDKSAFTVNEVLSAVANLPASSILNSEMMSIHDLSTVAKVCVALNKKGLLLFLRNIHNIGNSWIILQKEFLLKKISGSIFAPMDQKGYKLLASSTGIVPSSKLAKEFPDIDTDLITSFMTHFQFCHEVRDPEILTQLSVTDLETNKYFFFPGLVTIATPEEIWEDQSEFSYQSVWLMKCCNDDQFLSSTFCYVTIHCFAFSYAMAPRSSSSSALSIQRRCSVWKNGIFWQSLQGLDIIAELNYKQVILYIRARKNCELKALNLRSQLISIVHRNRQEYCSNIEMTEYFVKNAKVAFPLHDDTILVPLSDIAQSLIKCEPYCFDTQDKLVELNSLLYFEPVASLGESILDKLFSCPRESISNEFLLRFAEKAYPSMEMFITLLNIPLLAIASDSSSGSNVDKFYRVLEYWRDRNPTYSQLCAALAEYSIFAGHNPLNFIK